MGRGVEHDVVPPADSKDRIVVVGHRSAGPELALCWWRALGGQPLKLRAHPRDLLATQQSGHHDIAESVQDGEFLRGRSPVAYRERRELLAADLPAHHRQFDRGLRRTRRERRDREGRPV